MPQLCANKTLPQYIRFHNICNLNFSLIESNVAVNEYSMTWITWIFCPNLSKIDFHLRYNVVWTNSNVLLDFFGKSNFLNFSLIDSKWWKCKLFIIFYCEGVGIFRFFWIIILLSLNWRRHVTWLSAQRQSQQKGRCPQ